MGERKGNSRNVIGVNHVFSNFLKDIKESTGLSIEEQCEYIGKKMGLSSQTVRKYQNAIPARWESELLKVVSHLAVEQNMDNRVISRFYNDYSREVKIAHSGIQPQFASDIELIHIEKYDWDHMICPVSVEMKLEQFVEKSQKHFLYFCGTVKSGITGSVIKFMKCKMREEKGEYLKAFHIAQNSIEELRQDIQLKFALSTEKYVVLDIGFTPFPEELLRWEVNAKVIIVAHIPYQAKFRADMEYLVFNDLINTHTSVGQIVQSYAPDFYTMMKSKEERLGEMLVQEMREQTGGLPLAVRKICRTMYYEEVFKYEENLEQALSKKFYLIPALKDTYEELWEELMEETWKRVPEHAREALVSISYFEGDISLELFHYLWMDHGEVHGAEEILKNCYDNLLLMESGKRRNDDNGSIQGVRIFPMMKALIRFKYWKEREYHAVMKKAVEFYKMKAGQCRTSRFYRGHKLFFERGGEDQLITEVLDYCDKNELDQDYLEMTNELCGLLFLRESYFSQAIDIYRTRLKVAKRHNDFYEVLETYGCLMGINAKKNHKNAAVNKLEEAERFLERHPDLEVRRCHKYLHGKALKLLLAEKKSKEAMDIWANLLAERDLSASEQVLFEHWRRECMLRIGTNSLNFLDDEFQQQFAEANCWAASFSCALQIAKVNVMRYIEDMENDMAKEAVRWFLLEAGQIWKNNPMIEDRYLADYYMLKCYDAAIYGEEYAAFLKQAEEYYIQTDWFKRKVYVKEMAELLAKNGNLNRKNGMPDAKDVNEMRKLMYFIWRDGGTIGLSK